MLESSPGADRIVDPMPLVLVVEDEPQIAEILEGYLRSSGYRTERAGDGEAALRLVRAAHPDLILLDVLLPKVGGLEVLKAVRAESTTPVIMLTARTEELDKLLALELGADDYVTKPFRPREVMARVKAVLRRSQPPGQGAPLRVGTLELDPLRASVQVEGQALKLTATEFRLLHHLAGSPGRIFNRAELLEAALPESEALERVIDVHLRNLRRKLEAADASDMLQTVRGMGYRLSA
ncbi:MAG: Phosphate regulon transcriptional regulatory protein PhoB (SphR) [uncultured Truepera sp.]|uniref:Phosphate regulon transcriptional regulatory protein PhoB (SphR) n=1 Tax=uncultured Truepera sp. TaxID=543023 RepID=A0A6J4VUV1_9DEIN|nr:MAG: Phosphate regulon transcriptional regulatory protein PhoB (SphR) [uncultured Truepera sp.]